MKPVKQTIHDLVNNTITVNYIKDYEWKDVLSNPYDYTKYDHDGKPLKKEK